MPKKLKRKWVKRPGGLRCPRFYLGIDPGMSNGGMVLLSERGEPIHLEKIATKTPNDMWMFIDSLPHNTVAVIEEIHTAIPKIGKSSQSKLYGNYKELSMALTASEKIVRWEHIKPKDWMQYIGMRAKKKNETQGQWKKALKTKAEELFSSVNVYEWNQDALLIAEYCRRVNR